MTTFYKSPRINLGRLMPMVSNLKGQVKFLQETEVLPVTQNCEKCDTVLTKQNNRGYFVYFRCGKCKTMTSVRKGTILSKAKISFLSFHFANLCILPIQLDLWADPAWGLRDLGRGVGHRNSEHQHFEFAVSWQIFPTVPGNSLWPYVWNS